MAIWNTNPIMMDFIKSLFGKKQEHVPAQQALEKIRLRMKNGTCPAFDALFYCVVCPSARLSFSNAMTSSFGGSIKYVSPNDYDNDGACFELAAFLMAKADAYLFAQHRTSHAKIFGILRSHFVDTFSSAIKLPPRKTRELLAERLKNYNRIFYSEPNPNRIFSLVSSAIHDTLANDGVPLSPIRKEPPATVSVDDIVVVKSLNNMIEAFYPQMMSSIDKVVALSRR